MSNKIFNNQEVISKNGVTTFKNIKDISSFSSDDIFTEGTKKYKFIGCKFDENFEILVDETVKVDFIFEDCIFENFRCYGDGDLDIGFTFDKNCTFFKTFEFTNEMGKFNKKIYINDSKFECNLEFNGNFSDGIRLRSLDFEEKYKITFMMNTVHNRGEYKNIVIQNIYANLDTLDFTNISINQLSIDNIEALTKLKLQDIDFINDSKILFENIQCKKLHINNISQDVKKVEFNDIEVLEEFILERVDFKNTYFNDFDISKAKKVISKTSFIDAHLSDISWGDISTINANQSTFRQLKFVNDSQANYIEANNFYMMEMKKYKQSLENKKGFSQEKVVFWLSENISNFGQSWVKPLVLIVLTNISFYYIARIHQFCILNIENLKCTIDSFVIFVGFKLPKEEFCGVLEWWLINKIVVGILFYYLIIALKRKTKR